MKPTIRQTLILLVTLLAAVTLQGCGAVLTSSQVKEVATFAGAAKDYGTFPGAVIRAHADLRAEQKILEATTFASGDAALRQVEAAVDIRRELEQRATAADSALGVLNDYAALLVQLTADTYTNDLQGSAESLGRSVDKGIASYNKLRGTNLESFGALAAAGVRGAGGVYIRHKQARALKRAVMGADPVVEAMISEVEKLLALYLSPADLKDMKLTITAGATPPEQLDLIRNVAADLRDSYRRIADAAGGKQQISMVELVAADLGAADDTVQLALKALRAAETFRAAHRALAQNVTERRWLKSSIDQVKTLVDEVNEANRLRKQLQSN
ncbi:hypothetical protein [Geobacter sp.]|uniref:hypothetical protein n=1 Tax=Geobacter sp. TaxID=46610 RepID=UPI00261D1D4B|nr:hypothetical protein [Geobacter sp.]